LRDERDCFAAISPYSCHTPYQMGKTDWVRDKGFSRIGD